VTDYISLDQISKAAQGYWFSPDTVAHFQSRVESSVHDDGTGGRVWIESTTAVDDDSSREFKLARFDVASKDIAYVQPTVRYATLDEARAALGAMARG
jgi:hypothetical protein